MKHTYTETIQKNRTQIYVTKILLRKPKEKINFSFEVNQQTKVNISTNKQIKITMGCGSSSDASVPKIEVKDEQD